MKKFILLIILVISFLFFLSPAANAQTREECDKIRASASYNCLTGWSKCYYPCVDQTKDVKACGDTCTQAENACNNQVDADYKACLAAIPKSKVDSPATAVKENTKPSASETKQENSQSPDCRKIFDKESYKCLGVSGDCQRKCGEETKRPDGGAYFNSGEVYSKCTKANDCDGKGQACNEQALANFRACQDAGKQPAASEAKQENPKQNGVPVFISEWFSRFSQAIDGLIVLPGAFADVVYEDKFYLAGDFPKLSEMSLEDFYQGNWYPHDDTPDRSPNITVKDEQKAWDFGLLDTPLTEKVNITVLQGEAQIKSPDSPQFIPIGPKGGDTLQVTFLNSTIRSTSDSVQLRHTWSADSGAVINVPKWSEIKFREPVEVEGITSHTVELGQGEIEVKVRNNKPAENQFGIDAGWLGVTVSRTHFWVSQSQDKKLAVIGVYEGEVEVKTKDGKTIKVKPDGDKAGVVVVSQKLSPVKLALAGVALVVVGGVILVVKRKFSLKGSNKKKK